MIDGRITWIRSGSTHSGAKRRLEKTKASTSSRCGRRNRHERSVHSFDSVRSDVAPPDDRRAEPPERRSEAGGLRIVQDDDVARPDQPVDLARIRAQRPFVRLGLGGAQRPAVARRPVQAVVDPLRDVEERRVSLDHEPSRRDAAAAGVAQQRLEQLGDAAADRRRVDVDHCARAQHPAWRRVSPRPARASAPGRSPVQDEPASAGRMRTSRKGTATCSRYRSRASACSGSNAAWPGKVQHPTSGSRLATVSLSQMGGVRSTRRGSSWRRPSTTWPISRTR